MPKASNLANRLTRLAACVVALATLAAPQPRQVAESIPISAEDAARLGPGFVVWESSRSGNWRIYTVRLDGSELRQLSRDEPGRQHCCPHIAPDGSAVAYLSLGEGRDTYPLVDPTGALHLIHPDGSGDSVLVPQARTYAANRAVVWRSPDELIYIAGDGRTTLLDRRSGGKRALLAGPPPDHGWLIDPSLSYATSGEPTFSPYDRDRLEVSPRRRYGGCEPYFSHDGRFGFWVAGAGGPLNRIDLASRTVSTILKKHDPRLGNGPGYLYFPMFSNAMDLFAFAASKDEHDHFHADYDIYVALSDPRTLELIGPPVRFSFDPATDRFPDVWSAPEPLGRHFVEAPHRLEFAPGAGTWSLDYGDGATASCGAANPPCAHTYARAGSFAVSARQGALTLIGQVTAAAAAAPRPLAVNLVGTRQIDVSFDEEVDATGVKLSLDSKTPIAAWKLSDDRRSLDITLARDLNPPDTLVVEGMKDRAQMPNILASTRLALAPPTWPSNRGDLVFVWPTATEQILIPETGGGSRASTLEPRGRAWPDRVGVMDLRGGSFVAGDDSARALGQAVAQSNEFSLELRLSPARLEGRGVILSLSRAPRSEEFALEQDGRWLSFGLRTRLGKGRFALERVRIARLDGRGPFDLALSYAPGQLTVTLDGREVLQSDDLQSGMASWRGAQLAFGGPGAAGRAWSGTVEAVALRNRFLNPGEAEEDRRRYAALVAKRPAAARLEFDARLAAASRVPTLKEITPYHEALVVDEWELTADGPGMPRGTRLRVARWAIMDSEPLSGPGEPGTGPRHLVLELFAAHPEVASLYLADTLPAAYDKPLYYDATF